MSLRDKSDISWVATYFPHVPLYPYATWEAKPATPYHSKSKGAEALTYLNFVIQHYGCRLPKMAAFIHGHRRSWHVEDAANQLLWLRWDQQEFWNLRCRGHPGCSGGVFPKKDPKNKGEFGTPYGNMWSKVLEKHGLGPVPDWVASPCCAELLVPKEAIMRWPIELYMDLRQWLLDTDYSDYTTSRVFEYTWHVLWGNNGTVNCPDEVMCKCQLYGECKGQHREQRQTRLLL
ncbi:hypothetical protein N2152v2_007391 [Parachlorella kessleri]